MPLVLSTVKSSTITFDINIFGTSLNPIVRCIIGDNPGFIFSCSKLKNQTYQSNISLPGTVQPGDYSFIIEVILNDRLFVPIKDTVKVIGDTPTIAMDTPAQFTVQPDCEADTQDIPNNSCTSSNSNFEIQYTEEQKQNKSQKSGLTLAQINKMVSDAEAVDLNPIKEQTKPSKTTQQISSEPPKFDVKIIRGETIYK
jgi:hypothetical protein